MADWEKILADLKADGDAFTHGRRNDDCVNSMIACRALGVDWAEWIGGGNIPAELQEHHDRIEPYLDKWFENDPAAYLL